MTRNISKTNREIQTSVFHGCFRTLIKDLPNIQFRDNVELQQATKWLHENGRLS